MPKGKADQSGQLTSINYWLQGMNGHSANKEAAWLYVQWATSKKVALQVAIERATSARASIWENEDFLATAPVDFAAACAEGARTGTLDTLPDVPQLGEIAEMICIALNDIYQGGDARTVLAATQIKTEEALSR